MQNIVFVLKEVNGGKDWDLREYLREGGQGKTWNNIVRGTKGVLNLDKHYSWTELDYISKDDRKNELAKICAMNVKKTAGKGNADDKLLSSKRTH